LAGRRDTAAFFTVVKQAAVESPEVA